MGSGCGRVHKGMMKPYWITFEPMPQPTALNMGAGVTARSDGDARRIANAAFATAKIATVIVVDDAASLEQGHVLPNMGSMIVRGVWFPLGYEGVAAEVR